MKDVIFLSHANPEDNEFTLWLALQLGASGYFVWCDLVQLMGGEDTWREIEVVLRDRTAKFIYVLSYQSNTKPGVLKELQLAENVQRKQSLKDFILPVAIDGLSPHDYNIQLARLHAVSFNPNWASGLARVLERLEKDGIPKSPTSGPSAVAAWWRAARGSDKGVLQQPERLASNLFLARRLPPLLLHEVEFRVRPEFGPGAVSLPALPVPGFLHGNFVVSFAPSEAFAKAIDPVASIRKTRVLDLGADAFKTRREFWSMREEETALIRLLNQAWAGLIRERSLPTYEFAGSASAFYFTRDVVPKDEVEVISLRDGARTTRQVVGYKTTARNPEGTPTRRRYWHFALEARPTFWPEVGYTFKPHLLFSDDGNTLWKDKARMHRAGRAQRRNWWNDHWRDLIVGTMRWLAGGSDTLQIGIGGGVVLEIAGTPVQFSSPVAFDDTSLVEPSPTSTEEEDEFEDEALATIADEE